MKTKKTPLYVDLDGTLLAGDSLHEALARLLRVPSAWLQAVKALVRGKAAFKQVVSTRASVGTDSLPYRRNFLKWLVQERKAGRSLILATGADRAMAERVADWLGIFDDVLASDGVRNLTGKCKLEAIRLHASGRPFAYAGDGPVDIPIFNEAASVVLVGRAANMDFGSPALCIEASFASPHNSAAGLIQLLRPHQWAKNILVFLPAAAAHRLLDASIMLPLVGLFLAFSLCASGVYAFNDILDLAHDRSHEHKRYRPLASGAVTLFVGLALSIFLPLASLAVAWLFAGAAAVMMLGAYWAVTTYYSLHGKRVPLLDVFLLAGLYTFRSFAGALPVPTGISVWMAAFLLFLFLSLACLKRFSELNALPEEHDGRVLGRGYRRDDKTLMGSLGIGAAFASTLVLCLYVASPGVGVMYGQPLYLMGMAPVVLFGLARFWLQASRGRVHADPVVHAMRDSASYLLILLCFACMLLATFG